MFFLCSFGCECFFRAGVSVFFCVCVGVSFFCVRQVFVFEGCEFCIHLVCSLVLVCAGAICWVLFVCSTAT